MKTTATTITYEYFGIQPHLIFLYHTDGKAGSYERESKADHEGGGEGTVIKVPGLLAWPGQTVSDDVL